MRAFLVACRRGGARLSRAPARVPHWRSAMKIGQGYVPTPDRGATAGPVPAPGRVLPDERAAGHDHRGYALALSLSGAGQQPRASATASASAAMASSGPARSISPGRQEWPDWTPPPEMIQRQPYLPRFMAGGPGNPLGARALYLGTTVYRLHGTNAPRPSAQPCPRAASGWSIRTSSTFMSACRSARAWWSVRHRFSDVTSRRMPVRRPGFNFIAVAE